MITVNFTANQLEKAAKAIREERDELIEIKAYAFHH